MNLHHLLRRRTLVTAAAAAAGAGALAPLRVQAQAQASGHAAPSPVELNPLLAPNPAEFKRLMDEFTGGKTPRADGPLKLEMSALADNPSAVPVKVVITEPAAAGRWCEEIAIFAELNPSPLACRLQFTPLAGSADAAVRIRLSQSQTVHALARMSDGQILAARQAVIVAASGCGM